GHVSGKILSHLEANDEIITDFVNLLPINRHCAIMIDSDLGSANQSLRSAKLKIMSELDAIGGFHWVTKGREIENYYSAQDRDAAIRAKHRNVIETTISGNRFCHPLRFKIGQKKEDVRDGNKVKIASYLVENAEPEWEKLNLRSDLENLMQFIEEANR
ncbi:hypothetical protein C8024_07495, partial [Sphingopyxis sp. BSNA05]|nr:hypothetical protein [Sphingopyxis sp. BSNA05]